MPQGGRPPHLVQAMTRFIEEQRVGSICRVLSIAPSVYYASVTRQKNPCMRSQKDKGLCDEIRRVWNDNFCVYGARKIWYQFRREGRIIARCTVERLMCQMGLKGVIRGKGIRTTRPDPQRPCPQDLVQRQFHAPAPNRLWVSDSTYVSTKPEAIQAENSHLPLRKRERIMQKFRSPGGCQRFVSVFSVVRNLFVPSAADANALKRHIHRLQAFAQWKSATILAA